MVECPSVEAAQRGATETSPTVEQDLAPLLQYINPGSIVEGYQASILLWVEGVVRRVCRGDLCVQRQIRKWGVLVAQWEFIEAKVYYDYHMLC